MSKTCGSLWDMLTSVMEKNLFFSYGETDLHIANECVYGHYITFALPQDSIFTEKFGQAIYTFFIVI